MKNLFFIIVLIFTASTLFAQTSDTLSKKKEVPDRIAREYIYNSEYVRPHEIILPPIKSPDNCIINTIVVITNTVTSERIINIRNVITDTSKIVSEP